MQYDFHSIVGASIKLDLCFAELCEDGHIRIGGAMIQLYGVLEVCVNSTWVAVCSTNWVNSNAAVVCRQLGYSPYGNHKNS